MTVPLGWLYPWITQPIHLPDFIQEADKSLIGNASRWVVLYTILQKHNHCNEDFNKRTNTLLYINLLHFILEKVMCVVCDKWEETRTDCYIAPSSPLDHSSISVSSWLGCSTVGHWGPQIPQSASWFSSWHPVSDWLEPSGHLVILLSIVHLLPLFFCLFTQVHLLIDGSVEVQYI